MARIAEVRKERMKQKWSGHLCRLLPPLFVYFSLFVSPFLVCALDGGLAGFSKALCFCRATDLSAHLSV